MTRSTPRATTLLGLVFVLLSALGLATQNVISRIFFVPSQLFGQLSFGGFIEPQLANVVLLLAIRMAMMALLLASVSPWLYPNTFSALYKLPKSPRLFQYVLGSSASLFIGLICLYTALSQIKAGIAIAIFFIYPAVTVLLDWYFFRHRLPHYKLGVMAIILVGVVFTTLNTSPPSPDSNLMLGLLNAAGAGLSFGVYGILAEVCLQHQPSHKALHPVPFSLSTFIAVAGLTGLTLPFLAPIDIAPSAWKTLLALTLFSATITLIAYVFNNFGIRYIGASLTALISASSPALTALFAWFTLQETLQGQQLLGVGLVTAGVAILSIKAD